MTKIHYPEDGISYQIKSKMSLASQDAQNAMGNADFNIPTSFKYRSYLLNLKNTISGYKKEVTLINDKARRNDNRFENLANELNDDVKRLEKVTISERETII